MQIKPVIMAGGSGTRLWPLSRENYPKQFIKIFDGKSLLQHCLTRNAGFSKPVLIVGNEHRFIAAEQAREIGIEVDIIIEPTGKNTAPCAILAAILANEDDQILLLPADHYISDVDSYLESVLEACEISVENSICTIGINPTYAHTGYGYIKLGDRISNNSYKVDKFVEKPNSKLAKEYYESGWYLWNSGIFAFSPRDMLNLAEKYTKNMIKLVRESYKNSDRDLEFTRLKAEPYSLIEADSIDYAIMEKVDNISVVKSSFGWSDLGSFSSIWDVSNKDEKENLFIGDVISENSSKNYVYSPNKLTSIVGVDGLIVVSTEDATLVASKEKSEDVKLIVNSLKNKSREEVKNSVICYRPWGSYQTIDEGEFHKVKRIIVKPSQKLSLQYHHKRAEHWVVVRGVAEVQVGEEVHILNENDSIYIHKLVKHRLCNIGEIDLHLIEVQTGDYLGEDDIVRLTDVYGRK